MPVLPVYGSDPSTPSSGLRRLYAKAAGIFTMDSAGAVRNLMPVECHDFSTGGVLTVQVGKGRVYFRDSCVIESVTIGVNTAPTGSTLIVDVNKNGTSIFATTQANRPAIAISAFTANSGTPDTTAIAAADYISCDIDQIGSTIAGSDLTVSIRLRRV